MDNAVQNARHRDRNRIRLRAYYRAHSEKLKAQRQAYNKAHPEKRKTQSRSWREANPDKAWANDLRKRYALTPEDYEAQFRAQEGKCRFCRRPETSIDPRTGKVRRLVVDHNHATGKVRWLLCNRCNVMLGMAQDDAATLEEAARCLREEAHRNLRRAS